MKKHGHRWLVPIGWAVLLAVSGIGCATDAVTGKTVYNMYSVQEDIALGQQAMAANLDELQKQGVALNADPQRVAQINEIIQRLAAVANLPQLPYQFTLVHTNIVNAAAMPGGQMIVFEGLYHPEEGLVHDEDELAAVMAHEIAHVNCRHGTERLTVLLTTALAVETAAAIAEAKDENRLALALRGLFSVSSLFWIPAYSRKDEFEADRVGLMYMARAGYDPRAAPRIWKRVAEFKGEPPQASIFASHPSSRARYETLLKLLPEAMEVYAQAVGGYPADYQPAGTAPAVRQ